MKTIRYDRATYFIEAQASIRGWTVSFYQKSNSALLRSFAGIKANHADEAVRKARLMLLENIGGRCNG